MHILIEEISNDIYNGKANLAKEKIEQLINLGFMKDEIRTKGIIYGLSRIFDDVEKKENNRYIPDLIIAHRAAEKAMEMLKWEFNGSPDLIFGSILPIMDFSHEALCKSILLISQIRNIDLGAYVSANKFINEAMSMNIDTIFINAASNTSWEPIRHENINALISCHQIIKLLETNPPSIKLRIICYSLYHDKNVSEIRGKNFTFTFSDNIGNILLVLKDWFGCQSKPA